MIELRIDSPGFGSVVDITTSLADVLVKSGAKDGLVTAMVVGSTAGLTVMRFEPGAVVDLLNMLERIAPGKEPYEHFKTTGDPNGASHLKSVVVGTSVAFPFLQGKMGMSASHSVVLADFDLRGSSRLIYVQPHGGVRTQSELERNDS